MRILGHIHTFNDEDVIDRSLQALLDQSHPLDELLIVDNGSTDGTLGRKFPANVTVIRHSENRGTSGAVTTGFRYALAKQYDWIWILDGDSAPRKDALEKLVSLYQSFPAELQAQTRVLASLPVESTTQEPYHQVLFTPRGTRIVRPEPDKEYHEFDGAIWTGCLFKLEAVRQTGLPSQDYVLDWGEYEYGYQGKRRGLRAFMHRESIVDHNIGGPRSFKMRDLPSIRLYYNCRNVLYFWLYEYRPRNLFTLANVVGYLIFAFALTGTFLLRPRTHHREMTACLQGIWHGLRGNMRHRY